MAVHAQRTIDFVGADMVEQFKLIFIAASQFQQAKRALNIGFDERIRRYDWTIDMRFSGKITNRIHFITIKYICQCADITNVCFFKNVALRVFFTGSYEVIRVAGIGQFIDIDNAPLKIGVGQHIVYEICSNEAAATGHH